MQEFTKYLMGVMEQPKLLEEKSPSPTVCIGQMLYEPGMPIPLMSPVIIDTNYQEKSSYTLQISESNRVFVKVKTYFPPNSNFNPINTIVTNVNKVSVTEPKQLLDNHCVKDIDIFKKENIGKIADYVKEHGVITFRMENPNTAINFMSTCLKSVKSDYRYSCFIKRFCVGNRHPRLSCIDDTLILFVSFFDLPYAIPVYNKKKADGMGVRIGMYWPKSTKKMGKLCEVDSLYFAVSMHPDNLLHIDGQKINKPGFICNDYIDNFCNTLNNEIKRRKDLPRLIEEAKQNKKKEEGEPSKFTDVYLSTTNLGSSATSYTYTTSSNTSTY